MLNRPCILVQGRFFFIYLIIGINFYKKMFVDRRKVFIFTQNLARL